MTPSARNLAQRISSEAVAALRQMPGQDVLSGMMCALLNVALFAADRKDVASWMRRLAEELEADAPAERLRVN